MHDDNYFIFIGFQCSMIHCAIIVQKHSLWYKERTERRRTRNYYEEYDNNDG